MMPFDCKAIVMIAIVFCIGEQVVGAKYEDNPIQEKELRYTYSNDETSSISISFRKIDPPLHQEEWMIVACITPTAHSICDFATTKTSTSAKFVNALSQSICQFQRVEPKAQLIHLYCSPFITAESIKSFKNWINNSTGHDKITYLKSLQDKVDSYAFPPLISDLNSMLVNYGYTISTTQRAGEKIYLFLSADAYVQHLLNEHTFYYLMLEDVH